jgi:hypothetical protein
MHDQPQITKHGLPVNTQAVLLYFRQGLRAGGGAAHRQRQDREVIYSGARLLDSARVTVAKPGSVTDNYFHQGSACFESGVHDRTCLIVLNFIWRSSLFLAFITRHVPDLAPHVLGDFIMRAGVGHGES